MTRLMALDVGTVRIGIAISDATGFLASPYITLHVRRDEAQVWLALERYIEETEAEGLIVGLPISLDGQLHMQAQRIQAFTERLKAHINIPLTFWDERLSTIEAERLLEQRGQEFDTARQRRGGHRRTSSKKKRGQEIDALAAAVILQDYLDHQRNTTEGKQT